MKKPLYKKLWFWCIVVLVVMIIGIGLNNSDISTDDNNNSSSYVTTTTTSTTTVKKTTATKKKSTTKATTKKIITTTFEQVYILNPDSMKVHNASCRTFKHENQYPTTTDLDWALSNGYTKCGVCW